MILKFSSPKMDKKKDYRVENGILYINNEPLELAKSSTVSSYNVDDNEDFNSIEVIDKEVIVDLVTFTDQATIESFFSVGGRFPIRRDENGIKWENSIEQFEGLSW